MRRACDQFNVPFNAYIFHTIAHRICYSCFVQVYRIQREREYELLKLLHEEHLYYFLISYDNDDIYVRYIYFSPEMNLYWTFHSLSFSLDIGI